jgi:glycosyltransferase involved in cell wall biosynthesis
MQEQLVTQNPLVSIILTTFNRDYVLSNAIESVLNQSYKNIELLIVDDGSTDNTNILVKKYLNEFGDKIKYYFKANGGQVSALNFGLNLANGDYIGFIDSDDKYKPNHVEIHIVKLLNSNLHFTMGSFELIHVGPTPMVVDFFNPNQTISMNMVEASLGVMFGQKKVFISLGGFRNTLVDIDMFVRIKASNFRWAKIYDKTYEYNYGLCNDSVLVNYTNNIKRQG